MNTAFDQGRRCYHKKKEDEKAGKYENWFTLEKGEGTTDDFVNGWDDAHRRDKGKSRSIDIYVHYGIGGVNYKKFTVEIRE